MSSVLSLLYRCIKATSHRDAVHDAVRYVRIDIFDVWRGSAFIRSGTMTALGWSVSCGFDK